MIQLELDLNLSQCECITYRDYNGGQRSIDFKSYCPVHKIYSRDSGRLEFKLNYFHGGRGIDFEYEEEE